VRLGERSAQPISGLRNEDEVDMFRTSTLDPDGSNAITSAIGWLERTLPGFAATIVAIIAIASVGLLMLGSHAS
jgi:type IV secretory pathway VirB2 component (pilin)